MAYRKTEYVIAKLAAIREAIIDAAVGLVEHGGREALTTPRLAKAAEVSEGGLYKHFADAGEIWAAVIARALQGDLDAIARASAAAPNAAAGLHAALLALYGRFTSRQLRAALFADANYREGLARALRPLVAVCLPEDDSRVAILAAAIPGALMGVYSISGQARGAADKVATFALRGLGLPSRVTAAAIAAAAP